MNPEMTIFVDCGLLKFNICTIKPIPKCHPSIAGMKPINRIVTIESIRISRYCYTLTLLLILIINIFISIAICQMAMVMFMANILLRSKTHAFYETFPHFLRSKLT